MDLPTWMRVNVPSLSSLASKEGQKYMKAFISTSVKKNNLDKDIDFFKECFYSIPPNFHDVFLEGVMPEIDMLSYSADARNERLQNILFEILLSFLSSTITSLNIDQIKFFTRNPERFFQVFRKCHSINRFTSYHENIWKYSSTNFEYLQSSLLNMKKLNCLTLRHLKLNCNKIYELILELSKCCPGLTLLDLKYSNVADSGLDPDSLQKFGGIKMFKDCIPALLKLNNLKMLNVSETWLTRVGVKALVIGLPLHRLDAIFDEGYDLQLTVIKDLMRTYAKEFRLPRTTYLIAQNEPDISSVCETCPDLRELILSDCYIRDLHAHFQNISLHLQHLIKISLCGLEWSLLMDNLDGFEDNPHTISGLVKEVTLSEQCTIDALTLGCLSMAFPNITHLTIKGADEAGNEPWIGGPSFTNLIYLHYEASLFMHSFGPADRLQGCQNILDVLLCSSHKLQSLTFYTSYLKENHLKFALSKNKLYNLKELRIGLQHELSINIFLRILRYTFKLEVLGRSDWWHDVSPDERKDLKDWLQGRFPGLIIYGADNKDYSKDPRLRKLFSDGW